MPAYRRSTAGWPLSATRCTGIMLLFLFLLFVLGSVLSASWPQGWFATASRFRVRTLLRCFVLAHSMEAVKISPSIALLARASAPRTSAGMCGVRGPVSSNTSRRWGP